MPILARYPTHAQAIDAARALIDEGVLAAVSNAMLNRGEWLPGMNVGRPPGEFHVTVIEPTQLDLARAIIRQLAEVQPVAGAPSDNWPDPHDLDLTKLPPQNLPPCPNCGTTLPPDAALTACPSCAEPVDVVELIVTQHGPEALEPCYAAGHPSATSTGVTEPTWPTDETLASLPLTCPACRAPLIDLAPEGACPACANPYNKRAMIDRLLAAE
ncbi:MAG: hypothetical protein CMJ31_10940 [Phycisphaerae bacterium]|nr:hypothetical protein [Phycisphaerae bacterium]